MFLLLIRVIIIFLNHDENVSFNFLGKIPNRMDTFFVGLFVEAEVRQTWEFLVFSNKIFFSFIFIS